MHIDRIDEAHCVLCLEFAYVCAISCNTAPYIWKGKKIKKIIKKNL